MNALKHYADAFARFAESLAPAERGARETQLARFMERGFPTKRQEDWRYTDLAPLAAQAFGLPGAVDTLPDFSAQLLPDCEQLVFVNGRLAKAALSQDARNVVSNRATQSEVPLASDGDAVTALNRAMASDGAFLRLPARRELARPLQILVVTLPGASAEMTHLAHAIELERGARATVILRHLGLGDGAHFTTQTLSIRLADGAQLELLRVQEEGSGTQHLFRCDAEVGRDARLALTGVDLGGGLVRNDWNVALAAPGAHVDLRGLYAPDGKTHVDNHTRIDHLQPHGTSREVFRGVVSGESRAVFNGKIIVHEGAQKTDSEQRVANLLLSKGAEVNAKPELEIYADDVKCAHGATFGQLDEKAVFYLRTRGLPEEMARALLTYTFAYEVLGRIRHEGMRRMVEHRFLQRLPQGIDVEGLL